MYLPANRLGLTAQITTPISLPGGIAGPIVFGRACGRRAWSAPPLDVWSDPRAQIRATVEVPPVVPAAGSPSRPRCPAISSQRSRSSITNTGRTDLIIGVSHFVWVPPPLPPPRKRTASAGGGRSTFPRPLSEKATFVPHGVFSRPLYPHLHAKLVGGSLLRLPTPHAQR